MKRILILLALTALPVFAQVVTDTRPATRHAAITPTNATALTETTAGITRLKYRAILVMCTVATDSCAVSITDGVPGSGTFTAGATVVYTVPSGTVLPIQPWSVNLTSTTAASVIGWW